MVCWFRTSRKPLDALVAEQLAYVSEVRSCDHGSVFFSPRIKSRNKNATFRESPHRASDIEKHLVVVFVVLSDIFSYLKEREEDKKHYMSNYEIQ